MTATGDFKWKIWKSEKSRDKDICGGCVYRGVPYEKQLSNKFGEVKGLLDKKDIRYGELLLIRGSTVPLRYRNKMEYTFGDMEKNGPMTLGMHKKKAFYVHRNSRSVPAGT